MKNAKKRIGFPKGYKTPQPGYKKAKGNISNNRLKKILNVSVSTLQRWDKKEKGYKNLLFWILKTMSPEELEQLVEKAKKLKQHYADDINDAELQKQDMQ